jgi:hypothetical protein
MAIFALLLSGATDDITVHGGYAKRPMNLVSRPGLE